MVLEKLGKRSYTVLVIRLVSHGKIVVLYLIMRTTRLLWMLTIGRYRIIPRYGGTLIPLRESLVNM
jgi:hypothetical protein